MNRTIAIGVFSLLAAVSVALAADETRETDNPHGALTDTCATCHGSEGWKPVKIAKSFDHGRFRFPLEATHRQTSCRACHLSLVFKEVGLACISCHQDAHQGELGIDCAQCHTPRSFLDRERMRRTHQTTRFPLTGAHLGADCEACHTFNAGRKYVNRPTDCVSCHLEDYNATRDPVHSTSGFSQNCKDCHNTVAFRPAKFENHDAAFFPINSGAHRGRWSACTDCHVSAGNYSVFSCYLGCHTHADQASVTSAHAGVSGFVYDSPACYACHPSP